MNCDTLICGGSVVIPGQGVARRDVAIAGETICGVLPPGSRVNAARTIDATGLHVLPGAIDPHTHWGNYSTFADDCRAESRAAALGGTTTALLFQRFLGEEETGDGAGRFSRMRFSDTVALASAESVVDFRFSPIVYDETTADMIEQLVGRGCTSFKFYLAYRNIAHAPAGDDWNEVDDGLLVESLHRLARFDGTLACVHAENAEILNRAGRGRNRPRGDDLRSWERANPPIAEVEAIQRAGLFAETAGAPLYVVHVSGERAVESLRRVQRHWAKAYGETCTHYLLHDSRTSSRHVKYSPPVRGASDGEALWRALADGTLSCVASDTVCTPASLKQGDVWNRARGASGAGVLLPAVLSEGVGKGRLSLEQAVRVTSENAARIFGLFPKKGVIAAGSDADLVLVDLNRTQDAAEAFRRLEDRYSRHEGFSYRTYSGFSLTGWPVATLLRGGVVAADGEITVEAGVGRYEPRTAAARPEPYRPAG